MKTVLFLAFCLFLFADEYPFPPDSKHVSIVMNPLGESVAVWEEKGRILVSEKPVNGNWSMPSMLSSPIGEAATPQLEIDSKGKVIISWVEGEKRKVASKPLKGEWAFKDQGDFSLELETLNREKKRKTPPKRTIQPLANAIDAPTSSVLSGGQIGFAAGTAAPPNGIIVSGIAGFGFSAIVNDVALPVQINAAAATERYFSADKAGTYGLLVGYTNGAFLGLTGAVIRNVPADPIYIYVNSNTQAMQITSAARVGLSCTPLNRLDVSGSVAIGTFAGVNTAPSNGLIVSGQSIFKATSSFVGGSVEIQGSDRVSFGVGGTKTSTDGSVQTGIYLSPTYSPTSNTSIVTNILSSSTFSPPMGVTIARATNVRLQTGGQAGAGAVTDGYNLYVENAGFGTNRYCAYLAGPVGIGTPTPQNRLDVSGAVTIGSYAGVNTAPSNGLLVSGQALFGSPTSYLGDSSVEIGGSASNSLVIVGNKNAAAPAFQSALYINPFYSPGTDMAIAYSILSSPVMNPPMGVTIDTGINLYLTGGQASAGTVNTGYSLYAENAGFGTNRYCAYLAGPVGIGTPTPVNQLDVTTGVAIGSYAGVSTAPSNGLIVSGQVGIGTTTTGNGFVSISPSTSNLYGLVVGGAVRGVSGVDDALGNVLAVTLTGPTAGATNAVELYVNPLFTAGAGAVTTMYGCLISAGTTTSNPTTGYGLFVSQPGYGATAYAANIQGGMVHRVVRPFDDYTMTTADYYVAYVGVDTTDVISLPDPLPEAGWTCVIKLVYGLGSMVTVSGNGHAIDGTTSVVLTEPGTNVVRIFSNGLNYSIW